MHKNTMYKIDYDQQAFQKFCQIKDDVLNLKRDYWVNVLTNENEKLILHMGEGPSMILISHDSALYLGGIAVLPNRHVL